MTPAVTDTVTGLCPSPAVPAPPSASGALWGRSSYRSGPEGREVVV